MDTDKSEGPDKDSRTSSPHPGAESTKPDDLTNRQWIHDSGYGGQGGKGRVSSDQREATEHTVHTSEWPEFSSDMLPAPAESIPAPKPDPTDVEGSDKPQK